MKLQALKNSIFIALSLIAISIMPEDSCARRTQDRLKSYEPCSKNGVVVTASPEATKVGVDVMERGGNAVDAAVAVGFALSVTYPRAGNIGGGGFMLVRDAGGKARLIDFRETAPMQASKDMYLDDKGEVVEDASTLGHASSGVPGTVAGLWKAHRLYGKLPWNELIDPAIKLAEEGFNLSLEMANSFKKLRRYGEKFPGLKKFSGINGDPLLEGEKLVQPYLAETLERIAELGRDGFYRGRTAELIVKEMERGGGLISFEDLDRYRPVIRDPIEGKYRGYRILSAPPPSSGGTILIEILNILEGYHLGGMGFMSCDAIHLMVEADKRAFRDRALYLGDSDFVNVPVDLLISKDYASRLRSSIRERAATASNIKNFLDSPENEETTHYSIVDSGGMAVATTTTLNGSYGSKVVVEGAGFLMNNEMDDFSIKPGYPNMYGLVGGEANAIAPGKRMLSSMAPTIVTKDGKLFLVLGTPGGSTIITSIAQIITDLIDFGLDPAEALSAPRFHHQWLPDTLYHEEEAFTDYVEDELEKKGHDLQERVPIGDVQLIVVYGSGACGFSDPRKEGMAGGVERIHKIRN